MLLRSRRNDPYRPLEKAIGYSFRKRHRLEIALTHRSFRFESAEVEFDNQRLEFLGDAVLGFVAGAYMFEHYNDKAEGHLTTMRSRITSGRALASIATRLELGNFIKVGKGEELSGGRTRSSNLADALESVIGAAYLDGGVKAVQKIFKTIFLPALADCEEDMWSDNPKGKLQELSQRIYKKGPIYTVRSTHGPSHARVYSVDAVIDGRVMGSGEGRNKRHAEARAAEHAVRALHALHPHESDGEQPIDGSNGASEARH